MKHQVLFFLFVFSFLSYASEHSRELADMLYGAQRFRVMRKTGKIDTIEEARIVAQCNCIANMPMTAVGKEEGMQSIYQIMQRDGSWNDLVQWGNLNNGPTKRREIR